MLKEENKSILFRGQVNMDQQKKVQMSISNNRVRETTFTSDLWGSGNEVSYLGVK